MSKMLVSNYLMEEHKGLYCIGQKKNPSTEAKQM